MDALVKDNFPPCRRGGGGYGGGGEAFLGDEWHPPKSSLFQNGFEAKLPPFQWLNDCSLFLRTFWSNFQWIAPEFHFSFV